MNMSFYTGAVGAIEQQKRLNVQGNNISNINTYGYKNNKATFETLMYGAVDGIDSEILPRGTGTRIIMTNNDFRLGAPKGTGRMLDYMIGEDGFFAVQDPRTGDISFTRDGSFTMSEFRRTDANGEEELYYLLSDGDGRVVLDANWDTIEVTDENVKLPVGVFDFANKDGMYSIGANRFLPQEKNGPAIAVESPTVWQGYLESSNTDLAEEMVKVIEAQRSFSYALRMVQTSDEIETTINGLRN